MKPIQLISPVDGSVYAERTPLSFEAAEAAVTRAKAAQKAWAARPLEQRIALVKTAVAKLNTMTEVVVEEIAWQIGRPTRYGGEFGGVNARTDYMASIAAKTLAPEMVEDNDMFRRYLARDPVGVVFIVACAAGLTRCTFDQGARQRFKFHAHGSSGHLPQQHR